MTHHTDLDADILAHLRGLPRSMDFATYAELARAMDVSVARVRASVARLVAAGSVAVHAHTRRAHIRHPGVPGASGHRYVEHQVYIPRGR